MLNYKNSSTNELSLGQKQKIAIASALAINPSILILDEPTTMLDPMSKVSIYETLKKLNRSGTTIIFVTNFIDEILLSDKIVLFDEGNIKKVFYKKDLFENLNFLKDFLAPGIISILIKLYQNNINVDIENFSLDTITEEIKKSLSQ